MEYSVELPDVESFEESVSGWLYQFGVLLPDIKRAVKKLVVELSSSGFRPGNLDLFYYLPEYWPNVRLIAGYPNVGPVLRVSLFQGMLCIVSALICCQAGSELHVFNLMSFKGLRIVPLRVVEVLTEQLHD